MKKVRGALISVYYKEGLAELVRELDNCGVTIYSTGGTQQFVDQTLGRKAAVAVEELTGYPSILGGRVKTLHPKVFGGILARRDNGEDVRVLREYEIPEIDLVIVDLYPFRQTVADFRKQGSALTEQDVIEKIDIGGISLIRAAAKNFRDVAIVSSVEQYGYLLELLKTQGGATTLEQRRHLAGQAFRVSSDYDTAIYRYFDPNPLRYGENPHQRAAFYGDLGRLFRQLHGKEISYNNLLDIDAALGLMSEFSVSATTEVLPAFVIIKHNNACGVAVRPTLHRAWADALAGDPVSAFGGVLIANKEIDMPTAEAMNELFFEVALAPGYEAGALELLKSKKNRIILELTPQVYDVLLSGGQFRSLLGGVVSQDRDKAVGGLDSEAKCVTAKNVDQGQWQDLLFANKIVKHSKSNAIVLARGGMMLGSGIGQTSRVDALKQAIAKAKSFGFDLRGAVLASDAFFPFADCAQLAHAEGITAIIQPGGSVRDGESIDYCDAHGMAMLFTGLRHFKH